MINEIPQGSEDWHKLRSKKIGASDSAAVLGISPWNSKYTLWRKKTGRDQSVLKSPGGSVSWAIDRGNRFEPAARAKYELMTNIHCPPAVFIHHELDFLMASLDGWNEQKKLVLEIKIPGKETFQKAKEGFIVPHYECQLEQQLLCSGGEVAHFFCCLVERVGGREQITDSALVEYRSNPELREKLIYESKKFWDLVTSDTPPRLTDKDTLVVDDPRGKEIFAQMAKLVRDHDQAEFVLQKAQEEYDRVNEELGAVKKEASPFFTHRKVRGEGVLVYEKKLKNKTPVWCLKAVG